MDALKEFSTISSDDELYVFLKKHDFVRDTQSDSSTPRANIGRGILGEYAGQVEGRPAKVIHRWYDPSGPFQNEPDIHKAKLEVDGYGSKEVAYNG
ncbi:hypothetical protein ACFFU8_01240 [Chromobacterium piscinae]|uniref:hypothetical protein n=1 Tax=Chromobacterium piscinae TaxID=686831 RepID=UPI001E57D19D|nr:hypothetical protein [Chromobacterium piscinae]MCD5330668.1 hypothetical protein [Chromobacterium piscinae]